MRVDPPYVLCSSIINFQYETKSTPEVWRCNGEMMCAVLAVCGGSMDRGLNPNLVLRSTTRSTHSGRHVVGAHVGGPQGNFIPTIFSFRLLFSSFLSLPSPFSFFLRADLQSCQREQRLRWSTSLTWWSSWGAGWGGGTICELRFPWEQIVR